MTLILETALTKPSLVVSGSDNGVFDQQGHGSVGVEAVMQAGNEVEEESENPPSLDSSLEIVFGPGATQLAKELENISDKNEELMISDSEQDSDSAVEDPNGSSPAKDQRKKRVRKNIKSGDGDLSNITGIKDNSDVSTEGENPEEDTQEVKKPRLGEGNNEKLAEGGVEDKDHTEGLQEGDKIFKDLLDMHEDVPSIASVDRAEGADGATQLDVGGYVPLEDPGPGIASVDSVVRVEGAAGANQLGGGGDVPLEDPGPKSVKHGGEGAAGATQ